MLRTPRPLQFSGRYVELLAPSKSSPDSPRKIQFYPSGKHYCHCPAWKKDCRHYKMTTIHTTVSDTYGQLQYALELVKDKKKALSVTWGFITCQFPENRQLDTVSCSKCQMFPEYCNIHPIMHGRNQKPLVWKIQSAIYNGRRKEARRMLRHFHRIVSAIRSKRE